MPRTLLIAAAMLLSGCDSIADAYDFRNGMGAPMQFAVGPSRVTAEIPTMQQRSRATRDRLLDSERAALLDAAEQVCAGLGKRSVAPPSSAGCSRSEIKDSAAAKTGRSFAALFSPFVLLTSTTMRFCRQWSWEPQCE